MKKSAKKELIKITIGKMDGKGGPGMPMLPPTPGRQMGVGSGTMALNPMNVPQSGELSVNAPGAQDTGVQTTPPSMNSNALARALPPLPAGALPPRFTTASTPPPSLPKPKLPNPGAMNRLMNAPSPITPGSLRQPMVNPMPKKPENKLKKTLGNKGYAVPKSAGEARALPPGTQSSLDSQDY